MKDSGVVTSARVKVVIEFDDLGTWDSSTTAAEVFRKAAETVRSRLLNLQGEGYFKINGEPVVELVIGRGTP